MRKLRVAVLCTHPLFGRGIAQLLQKDAQLEVTCLGSGQGEVVDQLRSIQPEAIVVEGYREEDLLRGLRDLPPALFIRVRLDDNTMDVYQSRQVVSACPEDLVEAIHFGLTQKKPQKQSFADAG